MLQQADFKNKTDNSKKLKFFGKAKLQILVSVAVTTFALIFAQLVFANNLATDGEKLSQIDDQIQRLEDENTSLKMQIAKETSLTNLSIKAKDQGFSQVAKIIRP